MLALNALFGNLQYSVCYLIITERKFYITFLFMPFDLTLIDLELSSSCQHVD